jgi:hypothetical protein
MQVNYVTKAPVVIYFSVYPVRIKRAELSIGKIVESTWGDHGYARITSPLKGWIAYALLEKIATPIPPTPPTPPSGNLVAALRADLQKECWGTYANIALYPSHKFAKDSPIPLLDGEVDRLRQLWNYNKDIEKWVIADTPKRIYIIENGRVKITSISGYYSGYYYGDDTNYFNVLERWGHWVKVETLKAGSGWHNKPIPPHLLHTVHSLSKDGKLINNPPGAVVLPVITRTGFGWIQDWQIIK